MGIAIRILKDFAANEQGYSIAGGQGYSNFPTLRRGRESSADEGASD
jgi:hypothetical protein